MGKSLPRVEHKPKNFKRPKSFFYVINEISIKGLNLRTVSQKDDLSRDQLNLIQFSLIKLNLVLLCSLHVTQFIYAFDSGGYESLPASSTRLTSLTRSITHLSTSHSPIPYSHALCGVSKVDKIMMSISSWINRVYDLEHVSTWQHVYENFYPQIMCHQDGSA